MVEEKPVVEENPVVEEDQEAKVDKEGVTEVVPCINIDSLSKKERTKLSDMLVSDFKEIMDKVGLDSSKAEEFLPDSLTSKKKGKAKAGKKKKAVPFDDWRKASCKEDLQCLSRAALVAICKDAGIPTSGAKVNKKVLGDRVWGIEHPEEAPEVKKGKRGRPKGAKNKSGGSDDSSGSEDEPVNMVCKEVEDEANGEDMKKVEPTKEVAVKETEKPIVDSEELRFTGNKLDPNGSDVYMRYEKTKFVVSFGEDVDYVGILEGEILKRGEGTEEFMELL